MHLLTAPILPHYGYGELVELDGKLIGFAVPSRVFPFHVALLDAETGKMYHAMTIEEAVNLRCQVAVNGYEENE